jgi:aryl-alcohol dehydrogenase-like predicted oxidoreductase
MRIGEKRDEGWMMNGAQTVILKPGTISMEKRVLGKTGMEVAVLGFGAAEIGFQGVPDETVALLINSALHAGLNVIDTAECYPGSEEKIGKAVSHRRTEYFLFTKIGHSRGYANPDWEERKVLEASIDTSLERLQTDHVDLLQLHSCSEEILRKGMVIEVLQQAKVTGKTRFIGYSGDRGAARYAVECGAFDTLQTSVSIADQESIELTLPLAAEKGIGVIAKRPIANAAWRTGAKPAESYHHVYWDRLEQLKYPFLSEPLDDAVSTALRFTLAQTAVATAIVGTTRPDRWQANAKLLDAAGPLDAMSVTSIRKRWMEAASGDWVGQG